VKAVFVELPAFARNRADYLDDAAFADLQLALMKNPEAGEVSKVRAGCASCDFPTGGAARESAVAFG
jgi:hypothetical protein